MCSCVILFSMLCIAVSLEIVWWMVVSMEFRYNFRSAGGIQTRDIEWDHPNPSVDKGTEPDVALTLKNEAKKSSVK